MKRILILTILMGSLVSPGMVLAQGNTMDDIHLFQTYLRDTPIALTPYGEAGLCYDDYDNGSKTFFGIQGGFPIFGQMEFGVNTGVIYFDPDSRGSETELSDCTVSGRYDIKRFLSFMPDVTKASAGAYATLPIGGKDVGEDKTDFGIFTAVRHPIDNGMVFTGVVGFDWLETVNAGGQKDRDFSLLLGGGAIYPINERLHVIGEFNFRSEIDYMLLTGGVDYELRIDHRVRGALGAGLDDGAPDLTLMISYAVSF